MTGVEGGSVESVEGDNIEIEGGVITDVEPNVYKGSADSKPKPMVSSSSSSSVVGAGRCNEVGVCTPSSSIELFKREGPGDTALPKVGRRGINIEVP